MMKQHDFTLNEQQRAKLALALSAAHTNLEPHLDSESMAALIEQRADAQSAASWKRHLAQCNECYQIFLEAAEWKLEHSKAQQLNAEKQKRGWLGQWRFAVGTVASVVVVTLMFYLMPTNQMPLSTPRSSEQAETNLNVAQIEIQTTKEETKEKERRAPTPSSLSSPAALESISSPARSEAGSSLPATQADAPIERRVQTPPSEDAAEAVMREQLRLPAKKISEEELGESKAEQKIALKKDDAQNAERIAVTGARVKRSDIEGADLLNTELKIALGVAGLNAYQRGLNEGQTRDNSPEVSNEIFSAYQLGLWISDAKTICQSAPSRLSRQQISPFLDRWQSIAAALKPTHTAFTNWPHELRNRDELCAQFKQIEAELR